MAEYGRMDPFSFAASKDVDYPVSIRMYAASYARSGAFPRSFHGNILIHPPRTISSLLIVATSMNLEGDKPPVKYSVLLERPDLRHIGSNTRCASAIENSPVRPHKADAILADIPTST